MSSNVFLAPCDDGFDHTVRSPVDPSEHPDRPPALDDTDAVRFWGAGGDGNDRTYFEKMEPGDLVLFYRDGDYVGVGRVGTTFTDDEGWASETFWDGDPADLVYTIEDFAPVDAPRAAVNRLFDYDPGYVPRGLMRVADDRVTDRPAAIKRALEKYTERRE